MTTATVAAPQATIPVLDLGPYLAGAPGAHQRAADELRRAQETVGFYFVVNHGVPAALIARVYEQARRFHALPEAVREAMPLNRDNSGYKGIGTMVSRASAIDPVKRPNMVEAFFIKRDRTPDDPDVQRGMRYRGLNQWPDPALIPGFRETCVEYQGAMERLGASLLPLYARALGLADDWFAEPFRVADITLRLSRYPAMPYEEGQFGVSPHTDSSFMTFLPNNDVAGLEIRPAGYDWTPAPSIRGSFLVNSGDMLKRWSNDRFLSTEHRARNAASDRDRYAVPFFMTCRTDHVIACLPTCQDAGHPPRYEPITYEQYLIWFTGQNYHAAPTEARPA